MIVYCDNVKCIWNSDNVCTKGAIIINKEAKCTSTDTK